MIGFFILPIFFSMFSTGLVEMDRIPVLYAEPVVIEKPHQSFGDIQIPTTTPAVLGDLINIVSPTPTPTEKPKPVTRVTKKSSYTIALLGDSMIDTLGPDVPWLINSLKTIYPKTSFVVKNYGVGGTNITYGIERITSGYTYLGNQIPALVSAHPDVVVIESFGYNPFSYDTGALDAHWLSLAKAVDTLRAGIPNVKIVIGATIAPNAQVFGDGAAGLSFSAQDKLQRVTIIKSYLENAVKFAKSQGLPLADAYHASLDATGNGKLLYINPNDHIHYSDPGRLLFAQKIAGAIIQNKLLE